MTPILKLNQGSFHFISISDCILQDVLMASSGQASGFQRKPGSVNFQRGGRSTSTLLIASLMLSVSSAAVLARDDSSSKSAAEEATQKSPAAEEATKKKKFAADEATNKALIVENRKRRGEGCCLAAAGRPADHDHAMGQRQQTTQRSIVVCSEAQPLDGKQPPVLRKQPDHRRLAMLGRHHGDADIQFEATDA
jgi:hypothetical protein